MGRQFDPQKVDAIKNAYVQGKTGTETARLTGMSAHRVNEYFRALNCDSESYALRKQAIAEKKKQKEIERIKYQKPKKIRGDEDMDGATKYYTMKWFYEEGFFPSEVSQKTGIKQNHIEYYFATHFRGTPSEAIRQQAKERLGRK